MRAVRTAPGPRRGTQDRSRGVALRPRLGPLSFKNHKLKLERCRPLILSVPKTMDRQFGPRSELFYTVSTAESHLENHSASHILNRTGLDSYWSVSSY